MFRGYVQIYTGNGKGKTTAAVGQAVRAIGRGFRVFFAQFIKSKETGELIAFKSFGDLIVFKQYGKGFVFGKPTTEDIKAAREGFDEVTAAVLSGEYQIVVLDEINAAVSSRLIESAALIALIRNKPANVELILTGRAAADEVIAAADLVTECKEIKHYYNSAVAAREGIEF
ncbi:cob(I)yrinic acid a,c-diamide adenosyltransferase [Candidatus Magnetomonas plexicatena]|uniref:cob(I)yrinic acid a,c-diamide adenosyltransferase n=1 Tax=Candidatus Magnetomonas plexicatena TaxID=2552947 RepID=UPI001C75AA11|nr:cob(I)yrinic acid a,c-diamide adenosyltransferase [Nitrospirales bacterium LBB_01]